MESTKKQENKAWRITSIVLNVVFYTLIAILLLFSVANLVTKDEEYRIPSLFGVGLFQVESPSMEGDEKDSFTTEDLIVVKKVQVVDTEASEKKQTRQYNKLVRQTKKLEVGDIITFVCLDEDDADGDGDRYEYILNTHRIIEVAEDSVTGSRYYVTRGDKQTKMGRLEETQIVNVRDIRAIYGFKLVGLGNAMKFIQSSNGFLLCIVLPTAIFFVVQLIVLILNIQKERQAKLAAEGNADLEALKKEMIAQETERIRAQILAEEQAKLAQAQKASEETVTEKEEKSE